MHQKTIQIAQVEVSATLIRYVDTQFRKILKQCISQKIMFLSFGYFGGAVDSIISVFIIRKLTLALRRIMVSNGSLC